MKYLPVPSRYCSLSNTEALSSKLTLIQPLGLLSTQDASAPDKVYKVEVIGFF